MRRVRDVEPRTRQCLRRGPFESVPGQVQQVDREAAVHDRRTADLVLMGKAVLPRARKQREFQAWIGRLGRKRREQRPGELVGIFADAAALAQGRPIVHQDAHWCDVNTGMSAE